MSSFLKSLFAKFPCPASLKEKIPEELGELCFSPEEKERADPVDFFVLPKRALTSVHPSWHEEIVSYCPEVLQEALLKILQEDKQTAIGEFLLGYLVKRWPEKNMRGVHSIRPTSVQWMLDCDREKLSLVVEVLPLHDLVEDIRQTVNRKILQHVFTLLSSNQQKYLKFLLQQMTKQEVGKIHLKELLRLSLEESKEHLIKRGFHRLAQALRGEDTLFLWHCMHRLERSYAQLLQQEIETIESPNKRAKAQLMQVYQFLKRMEIL